MPVIEKDFFDDLKSRINDNLHYSITPSIRRIVGPNNEDYDISSFNFIWALDDQSRMYQFLFQNIKKNDNLQSILVALAPPELGKLFSEYEEEVNHRIFSLLNKPSKIKFLKDHGANKIDFFRNHQNLILVKKLCMKSVFTAVVDRVPWSPQSCWQRLFLTPVIMFRRFLFLAWKGGAHRLKPILD